MNPLFTKVSNLQFNKASKIVLTLASSTLILYALGQAPIFKIFLLMPFLVLAKNNLEL
tara:strand:+ start:181 stop:354 length:174 start_codon:yes stop_codon:yes gene_type:complete